MRKVSRDKSKASSLVAMSVEIIERIETTDKERFPSQVVRDYYDVVHQLFEALASLEGLKFDGQGSH